MIRVLGTVLAGLLGLAFGSFLNVCLSRWPEGESLVKPRSHCRSCGRTLAWWENIPIASWIALRGRCRTCQAKISWRYPLVELTVGVLWALIAYRYVGWILDPNESVHIAHLALIAMFARMLFCWITVALAVLDAENLWLPDWLTWPGIAIGIGYSLLPFYVIDRLPLFGIRHASVPGRAVRSALACIIAAGLVLLIRWTYWLIRRREGIGLGDAKLMAMLGAWLGLSGALLSFAIGVALGAIFALIAFAIPAARRESNSWLAAKLPLGTFLCIGGIISAMWGWPIIAAYLRWAGF